MTDRPREPRAFRLQNESGVSAQKIKAPAIEFTPDPEPAPVALAPMAAAAARPRKSKLGLTLLNAIVALALMWLGLTLTRLITDFFAASPTLGWVASMFAMIAGVALVAIILREFAGLMRLQKIESLQSASAHAIQAEDPKAASATINGLKSLYANRADLAWPLKNWGTHEHDIMDARDRVRTAERLLLDPLDESAHRIIAMRSRRVALLTTVTPAATFDILFVAAQNLFMIREIAELYGGRPSFVATLRISRLVITHLAVAGGLALSENALHLIVGKGLLGRLSARFGEGAINGILTSRIGLAACEVCRPIAKGASKRTTLASLTKELLSFQNDKNSGD